MGAMGREIDAVLAALIPAGEPLVVSDYGVLRGCDAGLGRTQLYARARARSRELIVVGVTVNRLVLVPVYPVRGLRARLCCQRLMPHLAASEQLARSEVIVERGKLERRGDGLVLPVRFVRRDGTASLIEMHGDPVAWQRLSI